MIKSHGKAQYRILEELGKGKNKEYIYTLGEDDESFRKFLEAMSVFGGWEKLSVEEWRNLVDETIASANETIPLVEGVVVGSRELNDLEVPTNPKGQWSRYKKYLIEKKGFTGEAVEDLEVDTHRILRQISTDTERGKPVKGLVVGSVQSGKTTSMAALMAMSSTYGWNVFIILSGIIENLREQTERRLVVDMHQTQQSGGSWTGLEKPSPNSPDHRQTQNLNFRQNDGNKYITVTLKNKTRLQDLIKWLTADKKSMENMRVLIIDDEADQASIDTSKVDVEERTAINNLIVNLVHGKGVDGEDLEAKFGAMNYIGYTATPYANVLNEGPNENPDKNPHKNALYPENFISLLKTPNTHFGPVQIFGLEETENSGLDIIRIIDREDREQLLLVEKGESNELPLSFKKSIAYFLAASASLRVQGYKKPISMLVHTSIQTDKHDNVYDAVKFWISTNKDEVIEFSKQVWTEEVERFSFNEFKEQFTYYGGDLNQSYSQLAFREIEDEMNEIIEVVHSITLDEDKVVEYHNGLHLCADHSKNNKVTKDNEFLRLIYPNENQLNALDKAPVFLVIGGATLSRGLTIEGLISTYFARQTSAADTLMQMGRWFGYRNRIELYPRLWLSESAFSQFKFLATLDNDLRKELTRMYNERVDFSKVGPRLLNVPRNRHLKITADNKQKAAVTAEYNYAGLNHQTYKFEDDVSTMRYNIEITEEFIRSLGNPKRANGHPGNSYYWDDVEIDIIGNFLQSFKYVSLIKSFSEIETLVNWLRKSTQEGQIENWNVILGTISGKKNETNQDKMWKVDEIEIHKVERNQRKVQIDGVIDIGVLRAATDLYRDINIDDVVNDDLKEKIMKHPSSEADYNEIREQLGLSKVPQLIIYRIDKYSISKSKDKIDLGTPEDLIGIYISIPGEKGSANFSKTITVNIKDTTIEEDEENYA